MTKNKLLILLVLVLGLLSSYRLLRPGFFSMQDDVQVFRLEQFDKCLKDGQIPCRYITQGGLGYGYPLYNYYSPLPYAIGEVFHLIGFSYINSIKFVFIFSHLISGVGIFLFASLLWGETGGLISSAIYIFAPYRATDGFVRGAMAELLAISLIPFAFYFAAKNKYLPLTIILALILLTHNLFAAVTIPFLFVFQLFFHRQHIIKLIKSTLFAFCLSAFFILPAIFEKNLVTVDTMTQGYFNFVNHFATLNELFISRFWGYGASLWGPQDDMSFQIGHIQWLLPLLIVLLYLINQSRKSIPQLKIFSFFALCSLAFIFLTHSRSTFIWLAIPPLSFFQFPWRFLGFAIFCLAILGGAIVTVLPRLISHKLVATFIIILLIFLNISFFREDIWFPSLTDNQKLTSAELVRQSGAGLMDYWPKGSKNFPNSFAPASPIISPSDSAQTISFVKKSNRVIADIRVNSPTTQITLPLVNFPNWRLLVDNQPQPFTVTPDLGLITFPLPAGQHHLNLVFANTPIRSLANLISLLSLIPLVILVKQHLHDHNS